jgi:hypothetical protein
MLCTELEVLLADGSHVVTLKDFGTARDVLGAGNIVFNDLYVGTAVAPLDCLCCPDVAATAARAGYSAMGDESNTWTLTPQAAA